MREPPLEDTVATIAIDAHYESTGMLDNWTLPRVNALCRTLQCTPFELGRLCAVDTKKMKQYLEREKFPPPVCLHMALLEGRMQQRNNLRTTPLVLPVHLLVGN